MLLIGCPHCGPRNSDEFTFGGEVSTRPPADADPAVWRSYLYVKRNTAGWQKEQWFHGSGCRRVLIVERNNVTNELGTVRDVAGADE